MMKKNPMFFFMPHLYPPIACAECGEKTLYEAIKCPKCGTVFFKEPSGSGDFDDRCPQCRYSQTEENRKKTNLKGNKE